LTNKTMMNRRDVTGLLIDWRRGSAEALDRLIPLLYDELRRVARGQLRREHVGHSLEATALVHEVYLRLVNVDRMTIDGRAHFLALAARLMRQILVDHARRRGAARRGGDVQLVGLDEAGTIAQPDGVDILALNEALDEMASFDARQRDLVELKFFGGLTIDETATALSISPATVEREWALAKAWLYRRLSVTV
jgi:RNA polymerase sigma factor (TIGR02999 family)